MLQLVHTLKKDYLIGLVTDNKCDRIEAILKPFQLGSCFDAVVVSARLSSGKDYPLIFKHVLCTLEVQPEECVFIDNTAKNLIVPGKMGMQTILFDDENRQIDQFQHKLMQLLQGKKH